MQRSCHCEVVLLSLALFFGMTGYTVEAKQAISKNKDELGNNSSAASEEKAFSEWTRSTAIVLKTVEAGHGFDDMQKLSAVVGDARIVGLGEATHGTREFFQLKHRLVEFLASEKKFTIFSIEANMPEAYRLNDYILHGTGDPKELLKGMYFWTWNTQEVLAMIEWMRELNHSGKGHIEFTGFDMQSPSVSVDIVRKFVIANDAEYFTKSDLAFQDVQLLAGAPPPVSQNGRDVSQMLRASGFQRECEELVLHLKENRDFYLSQGLTNKDVDWVLQNAQLVLQYVQLKAGSKSRDESMAENVKWIADHNPGGRIILWAHNGHITRSTNFAYEPMGRYLSRWFGTQYVNFGFAFNEGSFRAVEPGQGLHEFSLGPAPEGSLDRALGDSDIPVFALNLRSIPFNGPVAEWMREPHNTRSIGAVYSDKFSGKAFVNVRIQDSYDALLFVNQTTAARGN